MIHFHRRPSLPLALFALLAFLGGQTTTRADQQNPSEHSPAFQQYEESLDTEPMTSDERLTSSVTLKWPGIAGATHYLLKISRDGEERDVVYTVDVFAPSHETSELAPGGYYYSVQGMRDTHFVGQITPQPFVVGRPLALKGSRERLSAPTIIGPKHMDLYPTFGYVRAAWEPVEGARGYRFRLWNEDKVRENQRWKRDTPPRWITEVEQPWIEINDAPYSSYMFLESGTYRWDVTAVDRDGGVLGEPAMAYFRTSRQWFLKPNEVYLRVAYGYSPNALYRENSSETGNDAAFNSSSHRLVSDADWWFLRQWGVNLAGGLETLSVQPGLPALTPADTLYFINVSASALYRMYLSTVPWGWTFTLGAGFAFRQFPQVDTFNPTANTIHVSRPDALGAKFGFRIEKKFFHPWELQLAGNWMLNAFTMNSPSGGSVTGTPDSFDLALRTVFPMTAHFATTVGLGYEHYAIRFIPSPATTQSSVVLSGVSITLGVQFNYFPPPDNSNYYPDHESAYYPSERSPGFYRSEERSLDKRHQDASPWQRWRDRNQ